MRSDVTELISQLRAGEMSLEDVANRFRERKWPRRSHTEPSTYLDLAAQAIKDPDHYVPGSFDDVVAAHLDGRLTDDEYAVLSQAVADSKRAEDDRER